MDTETISWKIYQQLLQPLGHDFTKAQYSKDYSGNTEIKNVTRLIQTYQLPWSVEEGLTMVKTTEQMLLERGVDLKVGVCPLLTHLKAQGYPMAVASSSTRKRTEKILTDHHILDFFSATVFAEDITHSKAHPEIFLKACDALMVQPGDAVVFEDSENGIKAACNSGIPVICIPDMKKASFECLDQCLDVYERLDQCIPLNESNLLSIY